MANVWDGNFQGADIRRGSCLDTIRDAARLATNCRDHALSLFLTYTARLVPPCFTPEFGPSHCPPSAKFILVSSPSYIKSLGSHERLGERIDT